MSTAQLLLIMSASSLMLASMAIAAIYFEKKNLIIQLVLIDAVSICGFIFKDFLYGEMDNSFLIKGILSVNVWDVIVFYLVNCSFHHIARANEARSEAGKGFAVVAEEVKSLAGKSSEAVNNTAGLIEASIQAVEEGKRIAAGLRGKMKNVIERSEKSAARSKLISSLTREQAQSLLSLKAHLDKISKVAAQGTETFEESTRIAEEVANGAKAMEEIVREFRAEE